MNKQHKIQESFRIKSSSVADDFKSFTAQQGVTSGLVKTAAQVKILSADTLCIIFRSRIKLFKVQYDLFIRIKTEQRLDRLRAVSPAAILLRYCQKENVNTAYKSLYMQLQ